MVVRNSIGTAAVKIKSSVAVSMYSKEDVGHLLDETFGKKLSVLLMSLPDIYILMLVSKLQRCDATLKKLNQQNRFMAPKLCKEKEDKRL